MSEKTIKVVTCDMCGAEIDLSDEVEHVNSVYSGGYYNMPVHRHNPSYDSELQDGVEWVKLDLCPKCADRACAIHCEVVPTEDGRSCRHEYTWREGR